MLSLMVGGNTLRLSRKLSLTKKYYGDTLSDVRRFTKRGADTALYRKQDAMGVMDDEFVFEKIFVRYDEENEGE